MGARALLPSPLRGGVGGGGAGGALAWLRAAVGPGLESAPPSPPPLPSPQGGGRISVALAFAAAAIAIPANPAAARDLDVAIGKAIFDRLWVQAPASTKSADGLGPLFAARSCASCHAGSGGRTTFRLGRDDPASHPGLVVRLGNASGRPDPTYGAQLQPAGVSDMRGEGRATVDRAGQKPEWSVVDWAYGAPDPATRASPRVAPSLAGVGLLARVPEAAILSREDPDDKDGDGISGRAARLQDGAIGRFGWKASEPTLEAQAAQAFLLDLGLSTTDRPDPAGDCTAAEPKCLAGPHGAAAGEPEVAPVLMAGLVAFLDRRPAPPTPAGSSRDEKLFAATGCAACHAPSLPLSGGGEARAFTDLLLHDMGEKLDDGMGEGAAKSAEWRTAPLWGMSRTLAQGSGLMHDGRAEDVRAAIGWHGGEAVGAKARFEALSRAEQDALLAYVNGL